jgi:hypothetical protein
VTLLQCEPVDLLSAAVRKGPLDRPLWAGNVDQVVTFEMGGKRSCGSAALLLYESAVANVRPTDLDLQKHTDHGICKV